MKTKTIFVVCKIHHDDFEYGCHYKAELNGNLVKITDDNFKGDDNKLYDINLFYHASWYEKWSEDKGINRSITVEFLTEYNNHMIFRGIYFLASGGEITIDRNFYYLYNKKNRFNDGHILDINCPPNCDYDTNDPVECLKQIADNEDYGVLSTYGSITMIIMNPSDLLNINTNEGS